MNKHLAALTASMLLFSLACGGGPTTPSPPPPSAHVVPVSATQVHSSPFLTLTGTVKNDGNATAINVKVYGAGNVLLDSGEDIAVGVINTIGADQVFCILANQTAPFEIVFYRLNSWNVVVSTPETITWETLK